MKPETTKRAAFSKETGFGLLLKKFNSLPETMPEHAMNIDAADIRNSHAPPQPLSTNSKNLVAWANKDAHAQEESFRRPMVHADLPL